MTIGHQPPHDVEREEKSAVFFAVPRGRAFGRPVERANRGGGAATAYGRPAAGIPEGRLGTAGVGFAGSVILVTLRSIYVIGA